MPILRFQDDGSIGNALGQLAAGINAANDPKAALQGEYIRQQIAASQASAAKTTLETKQLQSQMDNQTGLTNAAMGAFDAQFPRPQTTLAPDVQGPPMDPQMAQGLNNSYDANRGLFSASVRNAASRGGGPLDALRIGPMALAQSGIMINGAPTDEMQARQTQAMLTGQLPDAKTPFTDAARQALTAEEIAKTNAIEDFKQGVSPIKVSPTEGVLLPTRIAPKFGVQPNAQGQALIEPRVGSNPTEDMRNYERYAVQEREAGRAPVPFFDYQTKLRQATVATTEGQEAKGKGDFFVKEMGENYKSALAAQNHMATLDNIDELLKGVDPGKMTQAMEVIRQTTGLALDSNTDRVQAANAAINAMVPQMRPAGSGSTSNYEEKLYASALMSLGNTPGGNALIMQSLRNAQQLSLMRGQVSQDYFSGKISGPEALQRMAEVQQGWINERRRVGVNDAAVQQGTAPAAAAPAPGAAPASAAPARVLTFDPQTGQFMEGQ